MKNEIKPTSIDATKFESLLRDKGFVQSQDKKHTKGQYLVQAGFVKVMGEPGRAIYIPTTKTTTRIDISGFEMDPADEGIAVLGTKESSRDPFGSVKQEVQFRGRTEEQILATVDGILDHMLTLDAVAKVSKARAAKKAAEDKAVGWSFSPPAETKEEKAARLAKVAKEMNVEVSPNA